jgi:membrane fusion protein, multidrug efflux system
MKRMIFVAGCGFLLIVAGSLSSLSGCSKKEMKVEEKKFNVQVKTAEKKPLRPFIDSIGTLNPCEEVTVSAEIEGALRAVNVNEGTVVTKGMLLATINDMDYAHEVKRDEAALRQAEANLANARQEFQRKDALYKEELVTKQQYDDISTRVSLGEAELDRVKALLSIAKQKLSKTRILSPMSCVVKEKKVSAGDFVKNGTPLFVIIQPNPIKLLFTVPEKDVGRLKANQDVLLKVDAFPDQEFKGKISVIYPALEEKTRSLSVEALVPNPNGMLKPGLFAKVIVYTAEARQTVVVPITALLYEAEKVRVFVVEGERAKERQVKLGSKYGEVMEIMEGIKEGERVVVVGQQNLSEGAKVAVKDQGSAEGQQPSGAAAGTKPNSSETQTKGGKRQ